MPDPMGWQQALQMLIPAAGAAIGGGGAGLGGFAQGYSRGRQTYDQMQNQAGYLDLAQQREAYNQQRDQVADQRFAEEQKRQELGELLKVLQAAPDWATSSVEQAMSAGAPDPADYGQKQFEDMMTALGQASPVIAKHRDTVRMAAGDFPTLATGAKLRRYKPMYDKLTKDAGEEHYAALLQRPGPIVDGMSFADLDAMMQSAGQGYIPPPPKPATPGSFEDYSTATPERQAKIRADRKGYMQADDRPRVDVNINPAAQEDIDELALSLRSGMIAPSQLAKRGTVYNAVLAKARREHRAETGKELSLSTLENDYQAARKFTMTMNAPQMIRFNALAQSVVKTIDEVKMLGDELKQGGVQKWNSAKRNAILQVYGNTPQSDAAARYLGAVNTLKEEFANLAQGGYAPTEDAWKLANQQINADFGVKDLNASLLEVQRLINYRMQAFREQTPMLTPGSQGVAGPVAPAAAPRKVGRFEIVEIR